nr:uncharacterized mitochondrial protein AtMg00810-like [Tanacetum cinerariifolium]
MFIQRRLKKSQRRIDLRTYQSFEIFLEVFPEDLSGLPPTRQVEFQINLIASAASVARAPYRLEPSKIEKLSKQLHEISDKGFIKPNPAKIESIKDWVSPKSPVEIRQLLGLARYYRRIFKICQIKDQAYSEEGDKLVSWMSKKQNYTAMSSAEAEYVALSARCAQVMWMRTQLQDYGFNYNKIPLFCDSQSAIEISCNPVQHSRTKHIHTRFKYLVRLIGMRCLTLAELEVLAKESA